MMDEDSEFATLMERLRQGDQSAAWSIIDIYGPHIQRVVRRDMNQRMRTRFDSADFVQAVWASFFRQPSQYHQLAKPEELMDLLVTVARNKVIDETRKRFHTQKQDITREEPIDNDQSHDVELIPSRDPRPSQVAEFREQWNRLFAEQPPENRRILELRFAGFTYEKIAQIVDRNERTVRKIIEQLLEEIEDE